MTAGRVLLYGCAVCQTCNMVGLGPQLFPGWEGSTPAGPDVSVSTYLGDPRSNLVAGAGAAPAISGL
jgi:hypothetical protein